MQSQRKPRVAIRDRSNTFSNGSLRLSQDHRAERFLLQVATQAGVGNAEQCALILNLLSTEKNIRRVLDAVVGDDCLSGTKVATLLTLFAREPDSCTPADLAYHADVSRSSMTDVLDDLQARGWIVRHPLANDRRSSPAQLTEEGQKVTRRAVHRFLQVTSALTADLSSTARRSFSESCEQLQDRARALLAAG